MAIQSKCTDYFSKSTGKLIYHWEYVRNMVKGYVLCNSGLFLFVKFSNAYLSLHFQYVGIPRAIVI